ncbi:hypothetical protein A8W25_27810 [Streptomyces sp. ERV7]|uniref:hypothetical protein n=1 Tax=Streptomyces sp. ERV7 TaxID=1322334 RepID=UPI0007F37D79|nr:hypothetical protein [Streptomyces sp. ERV7]OAR23298.1 hypothetical protein A8W25_27810 [Streptomyces sp. ERV7]
MPLPSELRTGDVVLTRGTGHISRAICLLDGSEVSHAALAIGPDTLAEAVGEGLHTLTYAKALDEHDLVVGRTLTHPADMAPVLDVAQRYLGSRHAYAHQQIVLLAVLALTRRIPLPPGGKHMVRAVLDRAAGVLNTMAERGQQPMICSEFVYRCHTEARPAPPYALDLRMRAATAPAGEETLLRWAEGHPALPRVPLKAPTALGAYDPVGAEAALAPVLSSYNAAVGKANGIPAAQRLPGVGAPTDPSDEELLASMTAFGTALHQAAGADSDGAEPLTPHQALERIRVTEAEPNFVTPGDLLRTLSLTEKYRAPIGGAASVTSGLLDPR